jgi:hypothetical protein
MKEKERQKTCILHDLPFYSLSALRFTHSFHFTA